MEELIKYLEEHAFRSNEGFFNIAEESIYGLPLLKMLERGLNKEMDSIYMTLRDLLITREFIDANTPVINLQGEAVVSRWNLYTICEGWLRQIIALR
jgi:hypothetical protein